MIREIKLGPKSRLLERAGVGSAQPSALPFALEPSPPPKLRAVPRPQTAIRLTVEGNPIPWERVMLDGRRRNGKPQRMFITAKRTRKHQERIQREARLAHVRPLSGPVRLSVKFFRATRQRCDVDNLSKSVQDALNRYAYADDSQIVVLVAEKHVDPENPRTEIVVSEEPAA